MKKLSTLWRQLTLAAVATVALAGCNRAEYAMLPKTSSYHGTVAQQASPTAPSAYEVTAPAPVEAPEAVVAIREVSAAKEVATVERNPAAPAATKREVARAAKATAAATKAAAPKTSLMEKAVVQQVMKKADKLASKMQFKQHKESADVSRLSGYLRTGIILLLVGLLVSLIPGDVFSLIGGILAIVGIIFLVLWLLNEL